MEYCKRLVHVIASSLVWSTHCQSFYYWRVLVPGTSLYPQVPRFRFVSVRKPGHLFFLRVFPVFPLMKHHCKSRRCAFYEMKQPIIRAKDSTTKTSGALHRKEGRFSRIRCWASAASSPCALYVNAKGIWRSFASFSSSVGLFGRDDSRYLKFRYSQRIEAITVAVTPETQQTVCRY